VTLFGRIQMIGTSFAELNVVCRNRIAYAGAVFIFDNVSLTRTTDVVGESHLGVQDIPLDKI
jgi:hypothetical protein